MNAALLHENRDYFELVRQVVKRIEQGAFLPGEYLPKAADIAKEMGVETESIETVLNRFEAENIIYKKPSGEYFLSNSDRGLLIAKIKSNILHVHTEDLIELVEVREAIESRAIALACDRRTEHDLKAIEAALNALEEAIANKQVAAKADIAFHKAIIKASHNHMLIKIADILFDSFKESLLETRTKVRRLDRVDHFINEHRQMFNHIRDQQREEAVSLMMNHIENTIGLYRSLKE